MFRLNSKRPEVEIRLENGIYVFDDVSAEGKTYLTNTLNKKAAVEPVIGYTYLDYIKNGIRRDVCINRKVVVFDRYDMYKGEYIDLINELSKNSIVLIDCKDARALHLEYEDCSIKLYLNRIEVY